MTPLAISQGSLLTILPELLILASALTMMTVGAFVPAPRRVWSGIAVVTLVVATILLGQGWPAPGFWASQTDPYLAPVIADPLAMWGRLLAVLTGILVIAMAHDRINPARAPEFFGCLLTLFAGAMLSCAANDLILLFAALEMVSIPTYVLLAMGRRDPTGQEASIKYFLLSVFSSALLLFGLTYLYGLVGVTNLQALAFLIDPIQATEGMAVVSKQPLSFALIALMFVLAGLGFKMTAVPFHFYAPDVYQGTTTINVAVLSWVPKLVGFVAALRLITAIFVGSTSTLSVVTYALILIAILTMTVGNALALFQDNFKRLLAYSSVAHGGYLLMALAVSLRDDQLRSAPYFGSQAILYYLFAYALMTLGVFAALLLLDRPERGTPVESVDDLSGVGSRRPAVALGLTICLLSLAGIPPLAGFFGKFQVFASVVTLITDRTMENNPGDRNLFWWLAIAGGLNAAMGAYYYLRPIVVMYFRDAIGVDSDSSSASASSDQAPWPTVLALGAAATLSIAAAFKPGLIDKPAREAAQAVINRPPVLSVEAEGDPEIVQRDDPAPIVDTSSTDPNMVGD